MADTSFDIGLVEQVMRHSPVGMAVIDRGGRFIAVNPAYARIYGYHEEELIDRPFTVIFPPAEAAAMRARHDAFLDGHGDMDGEFDVLHRSGHALTVQARSVRLWSEGVPCRLVSISDVTMRRNMEREVQAHRLFLLRVLDGLTAHVCVLDAEGCIVIVNRAWRDFGVANGLGSDTMHEGSNYLRVCERAATGSPADAVPGKFLRQLRDVLAGRSDGFEMEYPCHSPQAQRWFVARVARLRDTSAVRVVIAHDDVTAQVQAQQRAQRSEAALRASEETYRTLFETVPQGVIYHDLAGRITSANPAAQRILGLTLAQLQGRDSTDPHWQAVHEDGSPMPGHEHPAMVALRTGQAVHDVVMRVNAQGRDQVWLLVGAVPLFKDGQLDCVYATFEDITSRIRMEHELERLALTDELTGVASRRATLTRLQAEFERLRRHPGRACTLLALDLDHFKQVNDSYGHAAGDAVLRHVARVAASTVRASDLLGRTGGEEFLVILPETSCDEALQFAERLCRQVGASAATFEGHTIQVSLSIGVAQILPDDPLADTALQRADRALYQAKSRGRNRVCLAAGSGGA